MAKPDRLAGSVTASQPSDSSSTNTSSHDGGSGARATDRSIGPPAAGRFGHGNRVPGATPRPAWPSWNVPVRAGDLDQRAGPDGEPRVDPPHERHRLVPDVGQAVARSDERLAGAELHPALDPERRDDPRAAQLDGDRVRAVGHDPARPGLRPHLAQERELLAADHRRMTRRDDLVDPAGPPVVRGSRRRRAAGRRAADGGTAGHDRRPSRRTPRSWPRASAGPSSGPGRSRARRPGTRGRSSVGDPGARAEVRPAHAASHRRRLPRPPRPSRRSRRRRGPSRRTTGRAASRGPRAPAAPR